MNYVYFVFAAGALLDSVGGFSTEDEAKQAALDYISGMSKDTLKELKCTISDISAMVTKQFSDKTLSSCLKAQYNEGVKNGQKKIYSRLQKLFPHSYDYISLRACIDNIDGRYDDVSLELKKQNEYHKKTFVRNISIFT